METGKIKKLLQSYFNGESTAEEEKTLETYFRSGNVAEELTEYTGFFNGISDLSHVPNDSKIEEEVMDYILENEHLEKTKYRWLWQTVTGIAASVIIVLGGFLFYQQRQSSYEDTFKDPVEAYAYAKETLQFVSGKYNKGMAELSKFQKIEKATMPIRKGITPVNNFYKTIEKMEKTQVTRAEEDSSEKRKSTDSI